MKNKLRRNTHPNEDDNYLEEKYGTNYQSQMGEEYRPIALSFLIHYPTYKHQIEKSVWFQEFIKHKVSLYILQEELHIMVRVYDAITTAAKIESSTKNVDEKIMSLFGAYPPSYMAEELGIIMLDSGTSYLKPLELVSQPRPDRITLERVLSGVPSASIPPLILFTLSEIFSHYGVYKALPQIDIPFHILGGYLIARGVDIVTLSKLKTRGILTSVATVGVLWEIWEVRRGIEDAGWNTNTLKDLVMDMIGGGGYVWREAISTKMKGVASRVNTSIQNLLTK